MNGELELSEKQKLKYLFSGDTRPYGSKCERCWRFRTDAQECGVLGMLCNRCYLEMERRFLCGDLEPFMKANNLTSEQVKQCFPYLK